jgi:hypothetical protein
MYHLELRQSPNRAWRFNLTEQELRAVLDPWVRQQIVELGEKRWAPERSTITVLEGPALEVQQLAMGRGWQAAQRSSEDVTDRVLAAAAQAMHNAASPPRATSPQFRPGASAEQSAPSPAPASSAPPADPLALAVQLAALLGSDPERLLAAWRDVASRASGLTPSESLALAERQIARPDAEQG